MKKSLVLLLVTVMLATFVLPVSASIFTDTAGQQCENAAAVLSALGIVEGKSEGKFEPASTLTRAEMTTILVRTMGLGENLKGKDIFTDVTSSHWAYGYISAAYELGVVNGIDAATFAPDSAVTYEQAVKMIVSTLGYTVQAEALGGYPSGYLAKASQLGILKGTSVEPSGITRGTMAILLYNSLEIKMLEKDFYGTDNVTYSVSEDTILSKYLKVEVSEGILSANYFTTLTVPSRAVRRGEVAMGSTVYAAGSTGADSMLGQKVKLYSRDYNGTSVPEILAVVPAQTAKVVTISASDITGNTTTSKLTYEDEGKTKDASYDIAGARLILNGKEKLGWTSLDVQPANGTVKLIMNNGVSADFIIVESYENYIVDSTNNDELRVNFKENGSMVIDPDDNSVKTLFIDENGNNAVVPRLAEWNILSVSESEDHSVRKIVQSASSTKGILSEYGTDSVIINIGTEEKSFDIATNMAETTLTQITGAMVGTKAIFYLDYKGNIAAVNTNFERDFMYGYLVGAGYTKGMDKTAQFKIFTEFGEMRLYNGAEKIKVNGIRFDSDSAIANIPLRNKYQTPDTPDVPANATYYSNSGSTIQQLVRFKISNTTDALLEEIETAIDRTGEVASLDYLGDTGFNKLFEIDRNKRSIGYNADDDIMEVNGSNDPIGYVTSINSYAGRYALRDTTVIFSIPEEGADDNKYSLVKLGTLRLGSEGNYTNVSLYDANETSTVGAMVWDQGATGGSSTFHYPDYKVPVGLVTDITTGLTEDGTPSKIITLFDGSGMEVKLYPEASYEIGYSLANTNVELDPYGSELLSKRNSTAAEVPGIKNSNRRSKSNVMIPVSELQVGDIIQYEATNGIPTNMQVIFRAATPGMFEWSLNNENVNEGMRDFAYRGGLLVSNGLVVNTDAKTILTKVYPGNYMGEPVTTEYVYRAMPTTGQMLLFDGEKDTTRIITYSEVRPDDTYVAIWKTTTQMMFIVYRNMD